MVAVSLKKKKKRKRQREQEYDRFVQLDLGDIIGVRGELFRTRTGETFLSPTVENILGEPLYASVCEGIDGSNHEGIVGWSGDHWAAVTALGNEHNGKPKVMLGDDPLDPLDQACDRCPIDEWSARQINLYIRHQVLSGVHPATPFHFSRAFQTGIDACTDPVVCEQIVYEILDYVLVLRTFLDGIQDWANEPGDEINDADLPMP